jgi:hypothetical protein
VRWDEKKNYWTNDGFYGISFNEGKQTLSFKTMHFGIFGLSAFRQEGAHTFLDPMMQKFYCMHQEHFLTRCRILPFLDTAGQKLPCSIAFLEFVVLKGIVQRELTEVEYGIVNRSSICIKPLIFYF